MLIVFVFKKELDDEYCFFFFQAEDGIRDGTVTGVQTCALPILGDAPRCGQNKCAKDARAFRLEQPATCAAPYRKSATADHAIVETKTAARNALAAWERSEQPQMGNAPHFRVSAQSPPERIVSDR